MTAELGTPANTAQAPILSGTTENPLRDYFFDHLVAVNGFVAGRNMDDVSALDSSLLCEFVRATQPDVWRHLEKAGDPERILVGLVAVERSRRGILDVLRNGIPSDGIRPPITLMFAPSPLGMLEPKWEQNLFSIQKEWSYKTVTEKGKDGRVDLVIAVNGIPVFAIELKNRLSGQGLRDAEEQFKKDRDPREPLFKHLTGCVAFFAMDDYAASMTTKLNGIDTKFMPFDQGDGAGGGGNPPVDGRSERHGIRTHYMLDTVWTRETITDLLLRYLQTTSSVEHAASRDDIDIIFPRYHQLRGTELVLGGFSGGFVPTRSLMQHSAGSGKSFSIAWLAAFSAQLVGPDTKPVFDAILVACDSVAIVRQLEDALSLCTEHDGMVAHVKSTRGLKKALTDGKRIILTTVQKFYHLNKNAGEMSDLKGRRFLVVLDEAHSSQNGEYAASLSGSLGNAADDDPEGEYSLYNNIAYVAFTATPRHETLIKFGRDGLTPHDVYSMRQAIEEGYILNPLDNYITHDVVTEAVNTGTNTMLPDKRKATRQLNTHAHTDRAYISHIVKVTLDHMVSDTLPSIGGWGRGMMVVSSREEVALYVEEMRLQAVTNPDYKDIKPVGAFTGEVEIGGRHVNEESLNGFPEAEITSRVSKSPHDPDACNLLVVADKYQTGYDEPLLCTLYLNKTLREPVAAMQTVSRINRIRRQNDKHKTSVIDFRGNETHVRAAFEKYGVTSTLPSVPLQPKLADLAKTIYTHRAITRDNVTDYAKRATGGDSAEAAREIIDGCRHRAETRRRRTLNGEQRHATFIADCHKFMHEYLFVSQLGRVHDPDMHALHDLLGMFLATYKPEVATPTDASWLENITIEVAAAGENLLPEQPTTPAISRGSRGRHRNRDNERKPVAVDDLVENHNRRLNQYFATFEDTVALPDGLVDLIVEEIKGNDKIERYALLHPEHEFVIAATRDIAHQQILKVLIENEPQDTKNYLLQPREMFAQNQEFREQVIDLFLKVAHQLITTSHDLDAETR